MSNKSNKDTKNVGLKPKLQTLLTNLQLLCQT